MSSASNPCRKDTRIESHLKMHNKRMHELETKINFQKSRLIGDILKLKKKENSSDHNCYCKSFCRIFHKKHNWKKSACQHLMDKLYILISSNTCNSCDKTFTSKENVKVHENSVHCDNFEAGRAISNAE